MTETTTKRQFSPWAIASLACSVCGILFFPGFILGIIFGHLARRDLRRDPELQGAGLAIAGIAVGWVGLALSLLFWLVLGSFFFFGL